jgi:hypothetical protein
MGTLMFRACLGAFLRRNPCWLRPLVDHTGLVFRLPFIRLQYDRTRFHFYRGWRERGNFGFKFNFERPEKGPAPKPADRAPPPATRSEKRQFDDINRVLDF